MSKLPSYSLMLIVFVALIHEHVALFGPRNSFQNDLNNCNRHCRLRPGFPPLPPFVRRNSNEICLKLLDHDNATITLCAGDCLQRTRELGNVNTCNCQNGKCTSNSTTTTTTTSSPTSSTTTTGSTTSTSTTSSTTTASTTTAGR